MKRARIRISHHLHVFDFLKLKDLVSPFLHIDALYSQIAGNGMKHPNHPRLLRKLDSNEKLEEVEAEWCLFSDQQEIAIHSNERTSRSFPEQKNGSTAL